MDELKQFTIEGPDYEWVRLDVQLSCGLRISGTVRRAHADKLFCDPSTLLPLKLDDDHFGDDTAVVAVLPPSRIRTYNRAIVTDDLPPRDVKITECERPTQAEFDQRSEG